MRPLFKPDAQGRDDSITGQLRKARRALRRTKLHCSFTVVVVLAYSTVSTVTIRNRFLQPNPAAALASRYVSNLLTVGNHPATDGTIQFTPSVAVGFLQMFFSKSAGNADPPGNDSTDSLQVWRTAMTTGGRELLSSNPGRIQEFVQMAAKPKTVEELGHELDAEIRDHLPSKDTVGFPDTAYLNSLCQTMAAISQLEWQLDRLAHGSDLSSYERTLRMLVVVTMGGAPQRVS
jgi:hypothetical protein